MAYEPDTWSLGDRTFTSRFILGSGKFNLDLVEAAVRDAGAEIVTLAVRRANTGQDGSILDAIPEGVTLLRTHRGRARPTRRCASRGWRGRWDAATS